MKKSFLCQLPCMFITMCFCLQCYAQEISSVDLISNAKKYDGNEIEYQGEVVGDIMTRSDHAWLNIFDGSNALGVWVTKALSQDIHNAGGYNTKGDIVKVSGIFNRSCNEHGGDLDIHATSISLVSRGRAVNHPIDKKEIQIALSLFCIILIGWLLHFSNKPRQYPPA